MKVSKTALCIGLSAMTVLSAGCAGNPVTETGNHRLYVKSDYVRDNLHAVFLNSATGKKQEIAMTREQDGDGFFQYSCKGDTTAYNKVRFTYGDDETEEVAFNDLTDGWYLSSYGLLPCTEGVAYTPDPNLTMLTFPYQGEDKDVYVWTPADYDPNATEKYSVIYLLDGDRDLANENGEGTWGVPESVTSAMKNSDFKAIAVGIATREATRYHELAPDLGAPPSSAAEDYETREGNAFCEFVVGTIVPAIEKQYNVYTDARHNAIAGSSLGGLESFYIGIEHPEKFGTIGAMSPSFWMYDESVWEEYLKQKTFDENCPFVYMYAGDDVKDNGTYAKTMEKLLNRVNYPKSKKVLDQYEKGDHLTLYWRFIFPELLEAMHMQRVQALM